MLPAVVALVKKDLLTELRTRETLPIMVLFTTTAFVIFHFSLGQLPRNGALAATIFWLPVLFTTLLGTTRLFTTERNCGGLQAFLLTPQAGSTFLVAKFATLSTYLLIVTLVALPIWGILIAPPHLLAVIGEVVLIAFATVIGLAACGTTVAALTSTTRAHELAVGLLALPLALPIVVATTGAFAKILDGEGLQLAWLSTIALYDMVLLLVTYALFDFVVED